MSVSVTLEPLGAVTVMFAASSSAARSAVQRHARVARLKEQDIARREVVDLGYRQRFDVRRRIEDRQGVALADQERRYDLREDRHGGHRARRDDRRPSH